MATNAALASESIASIHRWLEVWSTPKLVHEATIEWSHRLTRSLGRCYPERRLIRLAPSLNDAPRALLEEVLCHELAHLAAREIHGPQIRPHGPEWKALMVEAGFEPKTKLPAPTNARAKPPRNSLYTHRCPVCHLSWTAKRCMRRWRCAECVAAGLDGTLEIHQRAL